MGAPPRLQSYGKGYSWGSVAHSQVASVPGFWHRP